MRAAIIVVLMLGLAACEPASSTPTNTPHPSVQQTPATACPSVDVPSGPQLLVRNLAAPDDLMFDGSGRLLFSDVNAGTVSALNADGSVEILAAGLSEPEGIVVQPGRLLVAEQGRNRIVAVDPRSRAVSPWRSFSNRTSNAGIDGIGPILAARDATGAPSPTANRVVVPDSPNGVVWEVTADGASATEVASGLTRPVGAALDSRGRLFVSDEGGAVWVLTPTRHRFATLRTPDDVVVSHTDQVFVTTLGDNAIHEFDSEGHQLAVLSAPRQPQGISLDGADNLYYTEFDGGRINRLIRTFVLEPSSVTAIGAGTYRICPTIGRAEGFGDPLHLAAGSSKTTSVLQVIQPAPGTSGALQVKTSDRSVMITVSDLENGLQLSQTVPLLP